MSSEGLARRRKVRVEDPSSSKEDGSPDFSTNKDESLSSVKKNSDSDTEDCDSKETRLTLMEEVLLLGLKDKEV